MSPDSLLGSIGTFAGSFAPHGWSNCDGKLLSISQFNALFSVLGTTYGGDGIKTFAVPDMRPTIKDPARGVIRVDWTDTPRNCICLYGIYPSRD
jgi:microcystin-dependent protein